MTNQPLHHSNNGHHPQQQQQLTNNNRMSSKTDTTDDWMPEHCLPQNNHDDFSFTPLSLTYTSSVSSSSDHTDEISLPLPPSRLLHHHHTHTAPWSIPNDATLNTNYNVIDDTNKQNDGRASSPNSVSAFPPPSALVKKRRRPRNNTNDDSTSIVDKIETYLPICGASASVDTNNKCGDGSEVIIDDSAINVDSSFLRSEGREMTAVQRGNENGQPHRSQQQHKGERKQAPMREDGTNNESSLSQLSSGMELLAMLTCGLLNQSATTAEEDV
mmetsp:Transcript_18168/g.27089  ORF Transcript_18168/g.27089 Transcript_18168/m.27089 type:complete len:272 (-) Transcript_18168:28-843(-)